jgi:hypothetical protein
VTAFGMEAMRPLSASKTKTEIDPLRTLVCASGLFGFDGVTLFQYQFRCERRQGRR